MSFDTKRLSGAPDAIAPDGSEVRTLCRVERGSMAQFTLPPGRSHARWRTALLRSSGASSPGGDGCGGGSASGRR